MTNQEKKRILRSFRNLGIAIDQKWEEYERLRSWAERSTPTLTGLPSSGAGPSDHVGLSVEKLWEISAQINADIDRYADDREKINAAIEALEDERQRNVMRLYYLNGLTWEQVAEKMGYEQRWIFELHGRGLSKIEIGH